MIGVIRDVLTGIRNMRQFKVDLIDAQATADEHRRKIEEGARQATTPSAGGGLSVCCSCIRGGGR